MTKADIKQCKLSLNTLDFIIKGVLTNNKKTQVGFILIQYLIQFVLVVIRQRFMECVLWLASWPIQLLLKTVDANEKHQYLSNELYILLYNIKK